MSADSESTDEVCANCGIAALDNVKLKKCACKLVQYCTVECQKNHRPNHKKACKKRMVEIRENKLLEQPDETHRGECLICFLPLPIDETKFVVSQCCSKTTCRGCQYATLMSDLKGKLEAKCAFCRTPQLQSQEEFDKDDIKRAEANDPVALRHQGGKRQLKGDYEGAVNYYTKAAELGDMTAHCGLAKMYFEGDGVERDMKKAVHHWEEAAIGGHPRARYMLGCIVGANGNKEKAAKHFIIAAKQGHDEALKFVKKSFLDGAVSKEDYASALRGHQAAVDATKSAQREEAYAFFRKIESYYPGEAL
jgi:tetratricopeptide (TPR) repeat protein